MCQVNFSLEELQEINLKVDKFELNAFMGQQRRKGSPGGGSGKEISREDVYFPSMPSGP